MAWDCREGGREGASERAREGGSEGGSYKRVFLVESYIRAKTVGLNRGRRCLRKGGVGGWMSSGVSCPVL